MSTTAMALGPVSAALEGDLRTWVRRHGVVVWLDLGDHYRGFVDALAEARADGDLRYDVLAYRGSFLELMLALEDRAAGVDPPRLVLHLPGFTEDTVRQTPLLELYLAGARYRKRLDTLVAEAAAGQVRPEEIDAFVGQGALTLEGADAWLRAVIDEQEGGLAAHLRAIAPTALLDDLLSPPERPGYVQRRIGVSADETAIWQHLAVVLGMPESWRLDALGRSAGPLRAEDVAFAAASWALAVEYVADLRRAPVAPRLVGVDTRPAAVREACQALAAHLRDRHPDLYRRTADQTESLIGEEIGAARAEDLGRIDTFRFEEDKVLEAAIAALGGGEFVVALEYADVRIEGDSFWLRRDLMRRAAWQLVAAAAQLGRAVDRAGDRLEASSHADAVARYASFGAEVDGRHRHLEQLRLKLLSPQVPRFEALRSRLDAMREVWRAWADAWATDFNALCEREGFLPPRELQQRQLFEEVVRPLAAETTALFVIDAFRFEMGAELERALVETPATQVALGARFAELPTNTEVGMNVLAPVVDGKGRLRPAIGDGKIEGFSTGEYRVKDPETRRRAMHARVEGATCPWLTLAEVVGRDAASLRNAVKQAKLVVVHSEEIDKAGEKGVGPALFDTVMQQIRSAWQLLRDAGVKRFVFTADHGFLLLDGATPTQHHGRKIDPKRRHVLSQAGADQAGEVRVALSDLGYADADGWDLMLPITTAPFDMGRRARTFVHGGNSLQERLIPVLTVTHRIASGGSSLRYRIEARARDGVAGMHRIEARVHAISEQGTLDFGGASELELALKVPELPDVVVELCEVTGGAKVLRGGLTAMVGQDFEVFFRLVGRSDARVQVVLTHPSRAVDVEEAGPEERFAISRAPAQVEEEAPAARPVAVVGAGWLDLLPEGVREVFAHIEAHGVCREDEAAKKLGGARQLRRFSAKFEQYAAKAPFEAAIEVHAGVKRYVRKG